MIHLISDINPPQKKTTRFHLITVLNNAFEAGEHISRKQLIERVKEVADIKSISGINQELGALLERKKVLRVPGSVAGVYSVPDKIDY